MEDTHPDFDLHVQLLSEAGRLRPGFSDRVWAANTDAEIDALVEEAKAIVQANSEFSVL